MTRLTAILMAALLSTLGLRGVAAEVDAAVEVRVADAATGRPISGATITLVHEQGGERATASSGADGRALVDAAREGLHAIEVDADGYARAVEPGVRLVRGKVESVVFSLAHAALSELDEAVVSARASRADPLATPSSVELNREEIRRAPGSFGDVFRALDGLPGVVATAEFSSYTVRGNGPRDNLILVDGIPFDKVTHFDQAVGEQDDIAGGGRYSIFAPNLIGGARFSPGGWRAIEGGRFGSLLELDVARGSRVSSTLAGQVDFGGLEASYEGPSYVADNTDVLLSYRTFDFSKVLKAIGEDNDVGVPKLTDIIFKSVTELNAQHSFELLGIRATEDYYRGVQHALVSPDFEDASLGRADQDSNLLGLTWRWSPGRTSRLRSALYYRDSTKHSAQGEAYPDLGGMDPTPASTPVREDILQLGEKEQELGLRTDFTTSLAGGAALSAGVRASRIELGFDRQLSGDWVRFIYDASDDRPDPGQQYIVLTPAGVNSSLDASAYQYAAYADYAQPFGALTITPGLRFDHDGLNDESLLSPRLMANWRLGARTQAWIGGGRYYQAPRYLDLAADPANAGLGHERSDQVSLGLSHQLDHELRFMAEGYYQWLRDLVVFGDRTTNVATNSGKGRAYGVDLMLGKRLSNRWSASATYSYGNSRRDDNLGEGSYPSDWDRRHAVGLMASWDITDRWSLSAKWRYASGRPADAFVIHDDVLAGSDQPYLLRYSQEITARNVTRLPDFHSLTLRADYHRRVGPVNLIAFIDVINVYGRENTNAYEFDERRGVNTKGGMDGVLPLLGIKAEYSWTPGR